MKFEEQAIRFTCGQAWLYGVLSLPEQVQSRGVLILVGGDQYRAGSHRQFTLLARHLASSGIPVMRFDVRGMGDSQGARRNFDELDEDARSAIDYFMQCVPGMTDLVIWGLCDAASAALFYAHRDERVSGLVLLNPWVRTETGIARAYLRHYYASRLFSLELWRKIGQGRFNFVDAGRSLLKLLRAALDRGTQREHWDADVQRDNVPASLPDRMFDGYRRFKGKVLLILSGEDLTAREFSDLLASDRKWRVLLSDPRTRRLELSDANHTFSTRAWRNCVERWTQEWLQSW